MPTHHYLLLAGRRPLLMERATGSLSEPIRSKPLNEAPSRPASLNPFNPARIGSLLSWRAVNHGGTSLDDTVRSRRCFRESRPQFSFYASLEVAPAFCARQRSRAAMAKRARSR